MRAEGSYSRTGAWNVPGAAVGNHEKDEKEKRLRAEGGCPVEQTQEQHEGQRVHRTPGWGQTTPSPAQWEQSLGLEHAEVHGRTLVNGFCLLTRQFLTYTKLPVE